MTLSEIQLKLKTLSTKDIGEALETLSSIINPDKSIYNTILLKQGKYNRLKKEKMQGVISEGNANLQMNKISFFFTEIVDEIEEDDINMEKAIEVLQKSGGEKGGDSGKSDSGSSGASGIYISYAWGGESEKIVDLLDKELQERGVKITRDKRDLGYKGSIVEFMKAIGQSNKIIVVISEKYLKSENCMFELTQIYENKDFAKRIFPIVLEDSDVYSPISRVKYIKYWNDKIAELDEAIKSVGTALNMSQLQQELNNYGNIRASFDNMAFILKDMNALTPDMHKNQDFQTLYEYLT